MKQGTEESVKEKSKLSKEEWREYTKTVWTIANTSRDDHPAVFSGRDSSSADEAL